ncbi:HAD domain-containing protein [Planotetraspora silvatica]|uniref:HAD domain-containing protein n=1 Tax=Planotetraspora silvatica TaxID=234614 RepID=UPI001EF2C7E4|nr:HAD domain-containing protein [Planotetraspora silvatica]
MFDHRYSAAMPGSVDRPLLFLDVDGPLIPFGAPQPHLGAHSGHEAGPQAGSNPLLARIDPRHGPRLSALPCDLVWATTWMADANEVIAPLLGLPELPVLDWPDSEEEGPLHWKTRGLVEWAAGRPFVWVDDEITDADRFWVSAHHHGQALLHRVDPQRGLTRTDFAVVADWLAQL